MENFEKLLESSLLVIWSDRNAVSRLNAMQDIYASDIEFYESNDAAAVKGHQAINELITVIQSQWPSTLRFQLQQSSKINHDIQHISWTLGEPGEQPVASGMDVAIIESGKIKTLCLFLDATANPQ
jgi:hypothetical protein